MFYDIFYYVLNYLLIYFACFTFLNLKMVFASFLQKQFLCYYYEKCIFIFILVLNVWVFLWLPL